MRSADPLTWPIAQPYQVADIEEVKLGSRRAVHPALWWWLALAMVLAVAVPVTFHVRETRNQEAVARMTLIASQVQAPAPMTALKMHHDCNGSSLVSCGWTASQDVDALAGSTRIALAKAAGMPAQARCSDVRGIVARSARSCMVQVFEGSHAITISIDPYVRRVGGTPKVVGSQYIVEAD